MMQGGMNGGMMQGGMMQGGMDSGLPNGWEVQWDSTKERHYFVDHVNRITTWKDPRAEEEEELPLRPDIGLGFKGVPKKKECGVLGYFEQYQPGSLSSAGGGCSRPRQWFMECDECGDQFGVTETELVPGKDKHHGFVLGGAAEVLSLDQTCENNNPEKARFCKNGMHLHVGGDFYVYVGKKWNTQLPVDNCCSYHCSACCPCTGKAEGQFRALSGYRKYDATADGETELLEFEDFGTEGVAWKCCMRTYYTGYRMEVRHTTPGQEPKILGGIRVRDEGHRKVPICVNCCTGQNCMRLEGLPGQMGGKEDEFAWIYEGEELPDGKEFPQNGIGSYIKAGDEFETFKDKCLECACISQCCSLIRKAGAKCV